MLIGKAFRNSLLLMLMLVITLWNAMGDIHIQAETSSATTLPFEPNHYGIVYAYPHSDWGPDKRAEMDTVLANRKAEGVTTLVQTFSGALVGTANTDNWLIFLDAAQAAEIEVIAYLWPRTTYPVIGGEFYYDDLKALLDVIGNHPALIGYIGLHEPLEPSMEISAAELQDFYTEMKAYAPHLKLAHYLGDLAYVEANRTDGWTFSAGMCDICLLWYYPFEVTGGLEVYNATQVTSVINSNYDLMQVRDPDAELWFLGQTFAGTSGARELRMPTPEEMQQLYLQVMEEPVDGFLWYPCNHTEVYDQVMCDPGFETQQGMVGTIGTTYVTLPKQYLPVVINEQGH